MLPARRSARFTVALLLLASACQPAAPPVVSAPAPTPVVASPTPAPAAAPRATRHTLPSAVPQAVYAVRVRTELERDSAGRMQREAVETSGRVTLTLRRDRRGALRGSGRVDSFVIRAGPALVGTPVPTIGAPALPASAPGSPDSPLAVNIEVALDSLTSIAMVQPALANECDRPEAVAAALARDMLVRVPDSVAVGDRWRDSLVTVTCRAGIPMTVRTVIESTLGGLTGRGDQVVLEVRRTITSRIEGGSRGTWRQVEITGDGRGTQRASIDGARGTLLELDGESTLVVRMTSGRDAARAQQVTQKATVSVRPTR